MSPRAAIFLDRDGVLTELVLNSATGKYQAPHKAEDVKLLPNVGEAFTQLRAKGYPIYLSSNQPDCTTGLCTMADLNAVHQRFIEALQEQGATLDGVYYCFHHPKAVVPELKKVCECRKPAP